MKKTLIYLLLGLGTVICLSDLYAMGVPQRITTQPIEYFNKKLSYKDPVARILDLTRKLPPEVIQSPTFMQTAFPNFSSADYLKYYDDLDDIRNLVIKSIGNADEGKYADLIEEVADTTTHKPFKRFKGDNLMSNIQKIAAIKIGKILGCTSGELEDGTCQPLKNSTDPDLSLEEKAAMPFAEFDKNKDPWTRDWVRLLPLVEMFDFYSNHKTWRIKFLDVINHPNKIKFIFKDDCKDLPLLLYNSDDKHQSQEMKRLQDIYLWSLPNFAQNEIIENIHHRSIEDGAIMTIRDGTGWKNKDYVRYRKEKFIAKLNSEKIPAGPRDPDIVWIDIYPQNA